MRTNRSGASRGDQPVGCLSSSCSALRGTARPPGDKSISHRAVMLAMLSVGKTSISGLLTGDDVLSTIQVARFLGAEAYCSDDIWSIHGVGVGALGTPSDVLDMGNAGTASRLLLGILATHPLQTFMTGDESLRKRPMARVITPLRQFGATFHSTRDRLPLMITGASQPIPITYTLPVASAQVKSAVLLAALNTPGITTVSEPVPTRDHTERMLPLFGVGVTVTANHDNSGGIIRLRGHQELRATNLAVPADISSAAFAMVAACIIDGSNITLQHVMNNPTRNGIVTTLQEMGADIVCEAGKNMCGEDTCDIHIKHAPLRGVRVPTGRVASMVDEFPIVAVAAACAEGETEFRGIGELRVKESDRLEETAKMLRAARVNVETGEDWMKIQGTSRIVGGGRLDIHGDHRLAMSTLVLGAVSDQGMQINDYRHILTSYPNFIEQMNGLGMQLTIIGED